MLREILKLQYKRSEYWYFENKNQTHGGKCLITGSDGWEEVLTCGVCAFKALVTNMMPLDAELEGDAQ